MLDYPPLPPRVIPCLLLEEGAFVKTKKFKNIAYIGDPLNTINLFNKFEVDEIIVIDIACPRKGRGPDFDLIETLASECWTAVTYGGGIQTLEEARQILNSGVEKILLERLLFDNPEVVRTFVKEFGSSSIVGCISVNKSLLGKYKLTIGGTTRLALRIEEAVDHVLSLGVGELVVNNIFNEGTQRGYDHELIKLVSNRATCPVVALGGAGSLVDLKKAINAGASAVSAGSIFVFQHNTPESVLINFPERKCIEELFHE